MKIALFVLFVFILMQPLYAQDSTKQIKNTKTAANPNFPFIVSLTNIEYDITINLSDAKVIAKYGDVFKQNNVPFTAESWEEVITGLYNDDSEMHHQVITSAQKDVLRIGTGGTEYQEAFLKYMLPVFSDLNKLGLFFKKED